MSAAINGKGVERAARALLALSGADALSIDYNPNASGGRPWEVHPVEDRTDPRSGSYYHGASVADAFSEAFAGEGHALLVRGSS